MTVPLTSPTFTADPLTTAELNGAFSSLVTRINEMQASIDALAAPAAPDLSGYATVSSLSAHVAAADAHRAYMKIDPSVIPVGKQALFQYVRVTLVAGTATATWPTSYATGAVLKAWAQDTTAAAATRVSAVTNTQATITGTSTDVIDVFVVGYI